MALEKIEEAANLLRREIIEGDYASSEARAIVMEYTDWSGYGVAALASMIIGGIVAFVLKPAKKIYVREVPATDERHQTPHARAA